MLDELLSGYNALEAELLERKRHLSETLRPKFQEAFTQFFERHPKLEAIKFTAYTPYFNDGEECVYSVNEAELSAFGMDDIESYSAGNIADAADFIATGKVPDSVQESYSRWASSRYPTAEAYLRATVGRYIDLGPDSLSVLGAIAAEYPAIQGIINSVPDDVIKGVFGDHKEITITRDGVEVEDYDHD